jgi:hypothetical protein
VSEPFHTEYASEKIVGYMGNSEGELNLERDTSMKATIGKVFDFLYNFPPQSTTYVLAKSFGGRFKLRQ